MRAFADRLLRVNAVLAILAALLMAALLMGGAAKPETARVVMLGSGTPIPDPLSSGPAVAIVINDQAYLFDAGAGVVTPITRWATPTSS